MEGSFQKRQAFSPKGVGVGKALLLIRAAFLKFENFAAIRGMNCFAAGLARA